MREGGGRKEEQKHELEAEREKVRKRWEEHETWKEEQHRSITQWWAEHRSQTAAEDDELERQRQRRIAQAGEQDRIAIEQRLREIYSVHNPAKVTRLFGDGFLFLSRLASPL